MFNDQEAQYFEMTAGKKNIDTGGIKLNHPKTTYGNEKGLQGLKVSPEVCLTGLTGGIASGKTTVADILKELGAYIVDFDLLAREVIEPGRRAFKDIVDYFGQKVLHSDGHIDRKKISRIVFSDHEKRKMLEGFTHPPILDAFSKRVESIALMGEHSVIIAVVPLLFELKLQSLFNKTILVYIPAEEQLKRLIKRNKIEREEALRIIQSQMPIDEKIDLADYLIDNHGNEKATRKEVETLWMKLNNLPSSAHPL